MNRGQGVLERTSIKLASVATDIMRVSGRATLHALMMERTDPATMAELAKGRLWSKIPVLTQALTALTQDHYRIWQCDIDEGFSLADLLVELETLEEKALGRKIYGR